MSELFMINDKIFKKGKVRRRKGFTRASEGRKCQKLKLPRTLLWQTELIGPSGGSRAGRFD